MILAELIDITIGKLRSAERKKKELEKLNRVNTIEYEEVIYDIKYYTEVKKKIKGNLKMEKEEPNIKEITMKTNIEETKKIFKMAIEGATFEEIIESPEFSILEFLMGEQNAMAWYEMYIESSTIEELKKYYNLPMYGRKNKK